ncbi:MAG: NTP transferase domain-containing protein [Piscinibacter sp.]|nr:NTP transferase domain-containing protein [Piscinibacter sp.]
MTTAIILAGGLGTRLRSAVPDLPKPMAPIAGRPFLEHQLDFWIAQGVGRFILSVGYRHEAISGHFGARYRGAAIDYAVEATPRGTGGALLLAAARLPDDRPALLLNGDTFFDVRLDELAASAAKHDADWCFALFRHDDPARYMGVALGRDGRITALRAPDAPQANGGVYWFRPAALRGLDGDTTQPLSLENDLFPRLVAAGQRFAGRVCDGAFIDIGVPADYHRAADVLPQGEPHVLAG